MEATMLYKTIVLELLQDHPQLYDQLLCTRKLLPTLERYASELRIRHLGWKELLTEPRSRRATATQIASQALELAVEELERRLPCKPTQDGGQPAFAGWSDGVYPQPYAARVTLARGQRLLAV